MGIGVVGIEGVPGALVGSGVWLVGFCSRLVGGLGGYGGNVGGRVGMGLGGGRGRGVLVGHWDWVGTGGHFVGRARRWEWVGGLG